MPPTPREPAYLWDMHAAAQDAIDILASCDKTTWSESKAHRFAVERCVELVGEAARHVESATRTEYSSIPWRQIVGMRNVLAHEYGQIDHARLFDTVTIELPNLVTSLRSILSTCE